MCINVYTISSEYSIKNIQEKRWCNLLPFSACQQTVHCDLSMHPARAPLSETNIQIHTQRGCLMHIQKNSTPWNVKK